MNLEYRFQTDNNAITLKRLEYLVDTIPVWLNNISREDFEKKPSPDKWSKKQILGHLIDSATNNHHRFVRAQFENEPSILYDQEEWTRCGHYDQMEAAHIIAFWKMYNEHIISLIELIPPALMERTCKFSDGTTRTIAWLFDDYVRHLEHHLRQIFEHGAWSLEHET